MQIFRATCILVVSLASVTLTVRPSVADEPSQSSKTSFLIPQPFQEVDQAASDGINVLEHLIKSNKQLARDLGLQSADGVSDAKMKLGKGRGIPIVWISLQSLKNYGPNTDILSLLKLPYQFVYPITVGKKIRSSVTVQKDKTGQWKPVAFSAAPLAPLQSEQLDDSIRPFFVRVYEFELWFSGALQNGQLMLSRIKLYSGQGDSAGKQENAREIIAKLAEAVKVSDKNPRISRDYRKRPSHQTSPSPKGE